MGTKTKTEQTIFATGVSEKVYTEGAEDISNLRYDPERYCWTNDRGFLDYFYPDDPDTATITTDVYSIYSYQQHKTAKYSLLYEVLNTISGKLDLKARCGPTTYVLQTGRAIPGPNDPGTQYVRMGKWLFIFNGKDAPLLYKGSGNVRPAFFHNRPDAPIPVPAPRRFSAKFGNPADGEMKTFKEQGQGALGIMPSDQSYGACIGPDTYTDPASGGVFSTPTHSTVEYAVAFVSDTGAEGPISSHSPVVSWEMRGGILESASTGAVKYLIGVKSIPLGPEGTTKRRLYRTGDQKDGNQGASRTLFYLADIDDNITTTYLDCISQSGLGARAPSRNDSIPFPTGIQVATTYKNHMVFSGSPEHSGVLWYSKGNNPEQVSSFGKVNVGGTRGGAITGLYSANNVCYIFRETSIDVMVATDNLKLPFRVESFITTIGSTSPNSIVDCPGTGIVFLGTDKSIYALTPGGYYEGQQGIIRLSSTENGDISETIKNISAPSLARAVATYNSKDQEYWLQVPLNGSDVCTKGLVYHTKIQAWSFRNNIPIGCFTQIPEGWTCFGSNATQSNLPVLDGIDESDYNKGIMVWCGAEGDGYYHPDPVGQGFRRRDTGFPSWTYETTWLSLGSPNALKRVKTIYLYAYRNTGGGGKATFGADWKPLEFQTDQSVSLETTFLTANSEQTNAGVFGTAVYDDPFSTGSVLTADDNRIAGKEIVVCRIDNPYGNTLLPTYQATPLTAGLPTPPSLSNATQVGDGGARWVKVRLRSDDKAIDLVGYSIEYEIDGDIKQQSFLAGKPDSNATAISILGL